MKNIWAKNMHLLKFMCHIVATSKMLDEKCEYAAQKIVSKIFLDVTELILTPL